MEIRHIIMKNCPFCNIERASIAENEIAYAVYDKYPVTEGHTLVIPKKHTADYFDLDANEKCEIWRLVDEVQVYLKQKFRPDGFNVGFNINKAAGQTIFHFHIHVIPRYEGDIEDPSGGVRGVIPGKRVY